MKTKKQTTETAADRYRAFRESIEPELAAKRPPAFSELRDILRKRKGRPCVTTTSAIR